MARLEPTTSFGRWLKERGNGPFSKRQRLVIVGVLVALAIAVTALTFWRDSTDAANERSLLADGSRSTALVENVFRPTRDNFVQLTLLIVDGDAEGWEVRVSVERSTDLEDGDEVEVAYDPDDPGDLVVVGETAAANNGLAFGAWVVVLLVAGRFALSTWQERRRDAMAAAPDSGSALLP
jgi:hypothetical protein